MNTEKFFHFFEKFDNFLNRKSDKSVATHKHKISMKNLMLLPLNLWGKSVKYLLLPCAIFATIMTLLSFASHHSLICNMETITDKSPFVCHRGLDLPDLIILLLKLFIVAMFLRVWYTSTLNRRKTPNAESLLPTLRDLKMFVALIVVILINCLPIISLVLLIKRVPNPDWRIESLYFAVVSCGFWIPIVAIRFYSIFAFILERQKTPGIKSFLTVTSDHTIGLLFSLFFVLLYSIIIITYYLVKAEQVVPINPLLFGIVGDFFYNVIILIVASLSASYLICTKQELFDNENNA